MLPNTYLSLWSGCIAIIAEMKLAGAKQSYAPKCSMYLKKLLFRAAALVFYPYYSSLHCITQQLCIPVSKIYILTITI